MKINNIDLSPIAYVNENGVLSMFHHEITGVTWNKDAKCPVFKRGNLV